MFTKHCRLAVAAGVAILALAVASAAQAAAVKPIITTLASSGHFNTFLKAVNTAGLAKTLHGHGPFTVFAPSDAAFDKLPPGQLNALMGDPARLKRVLEFHVIHSRLTVAQLGSLKPAATPNTLEGDPLHVQAGVGVVTVNGAAIVKPDIGAKNGVIHEIDNVLMPPVDITTPPGAPGRPARPIGPAPPSAPAPPAHPMPPAPSPPVNPGPPTPAPAPSAPNPPNTVPTPIPMQPPPPPPPAPVNPGGPMRPAPAPPGSPAPAPPAQQPPPAPPANPPTAPNPPAQ